MFVLKCSVSFFPSQRENFSCAYLMFHNSHRTQYNAVFALWSSAICEFTSTIISFSFIVWQTLNETKIESTRAQEYVVFESVRFFFKPVSAYNITIYPSKMNGCCLLRVMRAIEMYEMKFNRSKIHYNALL